MIAELKFEKVILCLFTLQTSATVGNKFFGERICELKKNVKIL
ncbi:hypothetical protein [Brachyspira intermedia]